jgi:CheY-like chemotaxis protein
VQGIELASGNPAPDTILLGITMPGMKGYEVFTGLKSEPKRGVSR